MAELDWAVTDDFSTRVYSDDILQDAQVNLVTITPWEPIQRPHHSSVGIKAHSQYYFLGCVALTQQQSPNPKSTTVATRATGLPVTIPSTKPLSSSHRMHHSHAS